MLELHCSFSRCRGGLILALILVSQGVVQNFSAYQDVPLVQSQSYQQPKTDEVSDPVKDARVGLFWPP